jgi:hypothetical protein
MMGRVLTPPEELTEETLRATLGRAWRVIVDSLDYLPVGWGSHHWAAVDTTGRRWFVTVDDLTLRRHSDYEPLRAAYHRLATALGAAGDLRDHGLDFVVAPVPTVDDGGPLARATDRYAVALYPHVDGDSFGWGPFTSPEHRRATLDMVTAVHTAPATARRPVPVDDFAIPLRAGLVAALTADATPADQTGPYARDAARLLAARAPALRERLVRYDSLTRLALTEPDRMVLTHGEPHPGNTMRTADGWRLIDWETALVAPPERDLWHLEPGDGPITAAYAAATGTRPVPQLIELYRLRWELTDIAVEADRFRRPHTGSADDAAGWQILRDYLEPLDAGSSSHAGRQL